MLGSLFTLLFFLTAAFAQGIYIGLPTPNQTVIAGSYLTVQIQLPDTISEYSPIAIAIGFQSCPDRPCFSPAVDMGSVLYSGTFTPERHETYLPPYENFTVDIDNSAPIGTAQIGVAYFSLVGAGLAPSVEIVNQTITVVP